YSTFQGIPAVATVARNTAFARYQSVPAFMRSYQYTPGFGRGYHTVSVVPPGTDSSKVETETAYNAAPAVHQIYQTAPALPEVAIYPSGPPVSAVTTFATSPQLAHYPRVQDFTRSAKYSFGLGQNYHTVAVVPPSTAISKISTYSPRNPTPIVTSYAATPIVHPVYRAPQVVPTGPSVSRLTKYSSFQSYPAVSTVVSKPGFARYQSVPAFMSSYQPTPGYGRSYHTVSVVPPATAVPKLSTYASYNPAPAVTTYSAAEVVRPIHHASPAVFTAPAVSSLTKYSSFQSYPAVSTVVSKPAFTRYQSVPAFMSSYQSTPRFGRGYHTV
ncbi:secreted salivary gland peptide, putative, partial [Ixodes scapularis]